MDIQICIKDALSQQYSESLHYTLSQQQSESPHYALSQQYSESPHNNLSLSLLKQIQRFMSDLLAI